MKKQIIKVLTQNSSRIGELLRQAYPKHKDIILYHQQEKIPFGEWFSFLFDGDKWKLEYVGGIALHNIEISETRFKEIDSEFKDTSSEYNILLESFDANKTGFITLVKPDDKYRIVDGYHRFYMYNHHNLTAIESYEWVKTENNNPFVLQIKQLIINEL